MGMLYDNDRDISDNQRFNDTSNDIRTEKQILWEDGIVKQGSIKAKLIDSFGRNDLSKLGRKLMALLMSILLWVCIAILVPVGILRIVLQCLCVCGVAYCEQYMFRYKHKLTRINIAYILIVTILSFVIYKAFNFLMWEIGYAVMLSSYHFMYTMIKGVAYAIRIVIMAYASYRIFRVEADTKYEKLSAIVFVISMLLGIIFRFLHIYSLFIAVAVILTVLAFVLYTRSENKFIFKLTLVFIFWSVIEIIGYNAVMNGAMVDFMENSKW